MALHSRYIDGFHNNRVTIAFDRYELLWQNSRVFNPHTKKNIALPIYLRTNKQGEQYYQGPNILDLIEKVELHDPDELEKYGFGATSALEPYIWRLRSPNQFFKKPVKAIARKKKQAQTRKSNANRAVVARRKDTGPFKSEFCTGGRSIEHQDNFTLVGKQSTVSISSQIYLLTLALNDCSHKLAGDLIRKLARQAWDRDLARAELLYELIVASGGEIPDYDVPPELKASSAVSQEVEYLLYCQVCRWLGIDPDTPVARKRGRPKQIKIDILRGEYLELRLEQDRTFVRTIAAIAGFAPDTDLATLSLMNLVTILASLQELDSPDDIDIIITFLNLVDPDWQNTVFEEQEAEESASAAEDPYVVLGVDRDASPTAIKQAYRNLMKKIHPDSSGLPDWIVKRINKAYEDLSAQWSK